MTAKSSRRNALNLLAIAEQAMSDNGFLPEFNPDVKREINALISRPPGPNEAARDLRDLLWSSIDDDKTRDLDQVEYAQSLPGGDARLLIAIAAVDAFTVKGSEIDKHAGVNCTSVYCGVKTFPMLPLELSTDLTSLVENEDRFAIVTEMIVGTDGSVKSTEFYPAIIRNKAKLAYDEVAAWLEEKTGVPEDVKRVESLEAQIRLQAQISECLGEFRRKLGAIDLGTIQAVPVADEQGKVIELKVIEQNTARELIANFMIAANVSMAEFLESKGGPSIRRVVRTPKYWDRIVELAAESGDKLPPTPDSHALADFLTRRKKADPIHFPDLSLAVVKSLGPGEYAVQVAGGESEGHFGLAVQDYTHSTAPNRRYADLITQRLVKAALREKSSTGAKPSDSEAGSNKQVSDLGASTDSSEVRDVSATPAANAFDVSATTTAPYTVDELKLIAQRCTDRESAARKVERKMRKVAAALLLQDKIGEVFDAIVTGVSEKGTFARVIKPPVDGRVMRGEHGMRVGDKVRVRLLSTDAERGFIDFARA